MPRRKPRPTAPNWSEAVEQFRAHLIALERSSLTVDAYCDDLARLEAWYRTAFEDTPGLLTLDADELRQWKRHQIDTQHHAPGSVNRRLAAVRSFLRWCETKGWTLEGLIVPKGVRQVRTGPQWLTVKEERALIRAVKGAGDARDCALVITLLGTGLRVAELCNVEGRDIHMSPKKGELTVREGKGAKHRVVPLNVSVRAALSRLPACQPTERRFQGQRGPLTRTGAHRIVAGYGKAIGVDLGCHTLRHTHAKRLVDAGVPLHVVARILGHESTKTTEVYVTPSQDDLQAYVDRLSGPPDD
jgi:integrase/recombinase XerC